MKTNITFGISFYLRRCKIEDGKALIYIRITVDGKRMIWHLKQLSKLTSGTKAKEFQEAKVKKSVLKMIFRKR